MTDIFAELQKLGFSQYECKAYVELLKDYPITGYEISKRSGVPRSMIYETLGKLVDKGAVHTVPSDPVTYAPLPAKELVNRLRNSFEQSFDYLERSLPALEREREVDVIRRISGNQRVIDEMIDIIDKAQEELWLSVWDAQVPSIQPHIDRRLKDGVDIFSCLFGAPDVQLGVTTHHDYMSPKIPEQRMKGRLTIVARDHEEVLIANFAGTGAAWAVKTQDPALVLVAVEYIRHDIMFSEVTTRFGPEQIEAFWKKSADLIHIVTGKRVE
ncbi:TrmB family transcriptional regulator [Paenibacillaceae bacterium]|nr:TrmB family transcriptional regulator [Paenibacillaceae bacterium]